MIDDITEQLIQRLEETMEINAMFSAQLERFEQLGVCTDLPAVQVKRLSSSVPSPVRATRHAAGWDLVSTESICLFPGKHYAFPLGIQLGIPHGYAGLIWPRSGLGAKHRLHRLAGLIDSDYRGECKAVLVNLGDQALDLPAGEKICQLLVVPCLQKMIEVEELDDTERGTGGFGSTDKKELTCNSSQ